MQWKLPDALGGHTVELVTSGITNDERVIGWLDDNGTILDNDGNQIGDIVEVEHHDYNAVILRRGKVQW